VAGTPTAPSPYSTGGYRTHSRLSEANGQWLLTCHKGTVIPLCSPDVRYADFLKHQLANDSVRDDFDQNPLITLDSVVSNPPGNPEDISADVGTAATSFSVMSASKGNGKGGRVYTATYSAKNSCGTVSTAAATVVVPHDQGN
jgi:hypothetical protein